jgi:hypothetical protein
MNQTKQAKANKGPKHNLLVQKCKGELPNLLSSFPLLVVWNLEVLPNFGTRFKK